MEENGVTFIRESQPLNIVKTSDGKLQVEYENNETGSRNIVSYLFLSVLYVAYIITFNLQIYNKDYTVSTYLLQIFFWQNSISIRDCMIT